MFQVLCLEVRKHLPSHLASHMHTLQSQSRQRGVEMGFWVTVQSNETVCGYSDIYSIDFSKVW